MLQIDKARFLEEFSAAFGKTSPAQEAALSFLLDAIGQDTEHWPSIQQLAYGLATFKWETAHTFQPITERGSHSYFDRYECTTSIGKSLGNCNPGDGFLFRGRGYVQVTGRHNYTRDGQCLNIDLISNPDLALEPPTAYKIAARGMRDGWFTGKNLDHYIPAGGTPNYTSARQIINGLDHAGDIAQIAEKFEQILKKSVIHPGDPASGGPAPGAQQ